MIKFSAENAREDIEHMILTATYDLIKMHKEGLPISAIADTIFLLRKVTYNIEEVPDEVSIAIS